MEEKIKEASVPEAKETEKKQEKADETCRNDKCSAGGREKGVPHTAVSDMGYQYIEGAHFYE